MNNTVVPAYIEKIWMPGSGVKTPTKKENASVKEVMVMETEAST